MAATKKSSSAEFPYLPTGVALAFGGLAGYLISRAMAPTPVRIQPVPVPRPPTPPVTPTSAVTPEGVRLIEGVPTMDFTQAEAAKAAEASQVPAGQVSLKYRPRESMIQDATAPGLGSLKYRPGESMIQDATIQDATIQDATLPDLDLLRVVLLRVQPLQETVLQRQAVQSAIRQLAYSAVPQKRSMFGAPVPSWNRPRIGWTPERRRALATTLRLVKFVGLTPEQSQRIRTLIGNLDVLPTVAYKDI